MRNLRPLLALGFLGLVVCFSRRVGARGPVELDGTAFGGTESSRFSSCNGYAGVGARYAGMGAEVRAHPMAAEPPATGPAPDPITAEGLSATATVAGDVRSYELIECTGDCDGLNSGSLPKSQGRVGARVRLGYDWRWLGFQAGAIGWEGLGSGSNPASHLGILPDVCLRIGPRDVLRGEIGLGAYNAPTVLRPGLYLGVGVNAGQGWDLMGHFGIHAPMGSEQADSQARADMEVRAPITETIRLGFGAAVSTGYQHAEPEARALVAAQF